MIKKIIKTLPNILTTARILISIFSLILYINDLKALAISLYLFGAFTDLIDGIIARKFNAITKIGIVLDQFADKMFSLSVGICFIISKDYSLPLLLIIEILVVILTGVYFLRNGKFVKSSFPSKTKTFFLFLTIMTALLRYFLDVFKYPYMVFFVITIISGIWAIYDYTMLVIKTWNNKKVK